MLSLIVLISVTEVGDAVGDDFNLPRHYLIGKQPFKRQGGRW